MTKKKTTVYFDPDLRKATKAAALTSKRSESAVVEEALRLYFRDNNRQAIKDELERLFARVAKTSDLDEDAALRLAVEEVRASRRERRGQSVRGM